MSCLWNSVHVEKEWGLEVDLHKPPIGFGGMHGL